MEVALVGAPLPRESSLGSFTVSLLDLGISFWKSVNVQRHLLLSGAFHLVGVLAKLCSLIDGKSDLSFAFV